MAEVQPVIVADGEDGRPKIAGNLIKFAKNLHAIVISAFKVSSWTGTNKRILDESAISSGAKAHTIICSGRRG
jgi:hypothetical protein